jgi:hypothetical protein
MAETMATTLGRLLDSFQPYPAMQFLLFAESWGALERTLLEYAEREGHTILLYTLREEMEKELPDSEALRHRPYRLEQPRYNLRGRLYNHAFVFGAIPDTPDDFARKVYTGIANAGELFLRLPLEEVPEWERCLEAGNYVALSRIEEREGFCLLAARKMHGWGG